jgi:hypothetical protein
MKLKVQITAENVYEFCIQAFRYTSHQLTGHKLYCANNKYNE